MTQYERTDHIKKFPKMNTCMLAGPIVVRRGHTCEPIFDKAYIGVFVCLTTKAVHLELISDLSTAAFLVAFRQFVATNIISYDFSSKIF